MVDRGEFCDGRGAVWGDVVVGVADFAGVRVCARPWGPAAFADPGDGWCPAGPLLAGAALWDAAVAAIRAGVVGGVCVWDGFGGHVGGGDCVDF